MKAGKTSWGKSADAYARAVEDAGSYQSAVILPNLLRVLAIKKGERVLDVACGTGFFSRAFAEAGAVVTGTDVAKESVAAAQKASPRAITFRTAPANKMPFVADGSMDAAVIVLAIQNIEDMPGTFAECARVLRKQGRVVIVMNHPVFRIPERSNWGWDSAGKMYRRTDGYLSDSRHRILMNPSAKRPVHTVSFHRPLQSYVKALAKNGFAITRLEEWTSHRESKPGPRAAEENRMRKEIPLFLCLEARLCGLI